MQCMKYTELTVNKLVSNPKNFKTNPAKLNHKGYSHVLKL